MELVQRTIIVSDYPSLIQRITSFDMYERCSKCNFNCGGCLLERQLSEDITNIISNLETFEKYPQIDYCPIDLLKAIQYH